MTIILYSSTMQNTEGGRKLNQAMVSTSRAVATTGRAVGEFEFLLRAHTNAHACMVLTTAHRILWCWFSRASEMIGQVPQYAGRLF
jgi:hypothetical protein